MKRDSMPKWKLDSARYMRRNPTPAEAAFWKAVRQKDRHRPFGKWRRQHLMYGYITDFYCPAKSLVVEIDGSSHSDRQGDDCLRDNVLLGHGIRTLRFSNEQVLHDLQSVLSAIHGYSFSE